MSKITLNQVETYLKELIGKETLLDMGYGGVLFLKIGDLKKKTGFNAYGREFIYVEGKYSLFSDENWQVLHKGNLFIDRWKTSRLGVSPKINKLKNLKIINFQILEDKTIITLEKDYQVIISQDKSLRTWSVSFIDEGFSIGAEISGGFYKSPYEPLEYKKPSAKKIANRNKQRKLDDDPAFKSMYKEDMPIAPHHVRALVIDLVGTKVSSVEEDSGDTFRIGLNDRDWVISINDSWQLEQAGKIIADSVKDKFNFVKAISQVLKNKKIISFDFDDDLNKTTIRLNSEAVLTITKTRDMHGEISLWTIYNRKKSYHISAYRNQELTHIITVPENLKEKYFYNKKGSSFASSMYALDFYREYLAEDKLIGKL